MQLFCGRGLQKLTVSKFGVRANALIRLLFSLYKARIHILEARIFSPAWAPGGLLTKVPTKSGYEVTGAARLRAAPGGGVRALCEDNDLSARADVPGASIASRHGVGFDPRRKD